MVGVAENASSRSVDRKDETLLRQTLRLHCMERNSCKCWPTRANCALPGRKGREGEAGALQSSDNAISQAGDLGLMTVTAPSGNISLMG